MSLVRHVSREVSVELPEWFQHIAENFQCPICYDTILIPVVYQCEKGHSFCPTCHKKLTKDSDSYSDSDSDSDSDSYERRKAKCPVCRNGR